MTYDELVKQLTADLQEAGNKNIAPPSGMSDAETRDWAMKNVAEAIAKAIRDGLVFDIKDSATVAELNAIPIDQRTDGDIWAVKDSGFLVNPQGEPLAVTAGDLVMWAGDTWARIFHLDLSGYATTTELQNAVALLSQNITAAVADEAVVREAADVALRGNIDSHSARRDNPHHVTAEQVGAATTEYVDAGDRANAAAIAANAAAIADEAESRTDADAEIITSLEDETTARRVNDELLQQQIEEVAVQTDWEQDDAMALDYLKNKPTTITDAEIEALFI